MRTIEARYWTGKNAHTKLSIQRPIVSQVGQGPGQGFNVNVPWDDEGATDGDYISAFNHVVLPVAYEFSPDLIIVSAGFDAAEGDPLGGCHVSPSCFAHMTAMLKAVAPTVLLLEGGYNLMATALSLEACLRVLLGESPPRLQGLVVPSDVGTQGITKALDAHSRYWRSCAGLGLLARAGRHVADVEHLLRPSDNGTGDFPRASFCFVECTLLLLQIFDWVRRISLLKSALKCSIANLLQFKYMAVAMKPSFVLQIPSAQHIHRPFPAAFFSWGLCSLLTNCSCF